MAGERPATIRIGGASGFWGDADLAVPQLLRADDIDYLAFDYLAEITLSIMARARARDQDAGYARDFLSDVIAPHLGTIAERRIKLLSNAGGVNPLALKRHIEAEIQAQGLDLTVASSAPP